MSSIIKTLRKALEADPSDWEMRLALTEALARDGHSDEAREVATAVEDLPEDEDTRIAAARCHALAGAPGAREIIDPVLAADPGSGRAHLALAFIAHREGDASTAARHFITATSLDPSLQESDRELSEAYPSMLVANTEPGSKTPVMVSPAGGTPLTITESNAIAESVESNPSVGGKEEAPLEDAEPGTPHSAKPDPLHLHDTRPLQVSAEDVSEDEGHPHADSKPELPDPPVLVVAEEDRVDDEVEDEDEDEDGHDDSPEESLRKHQEESVEVSRRWRRRDEFKAAAMTFLVHGGIVFALGLIVIAVPRHPPPQIVAVAIPTPEVDTEIKKKVLMPTDVAKTEPSSMMPDVISALNSSSVAVPTVKNLPINNPAVFGASFRPAEIFGPMGNIGQSMLFGEPIEGKRLGVILDVSGSMAEFLPKVIREIDRNFDKASIIFVNNAMLRDGIESTTEIRPILTDDVVPHKDGLRTPYWFLWGDLPRKAEQSAVDRLIQIFRVRQNTYLAVGGHNRVAGAMDHLRSLGIDALYIFSDFQDFIGEEVAIDNARKLSKSGVKTYVQPAQKQTEFLEIMSRKIASRTKGKELPPLISLTEKEEEPPPLLSEVMDPVPVEVEGVSYATARQERYGTEFYDYRPAKEFEEIEVFEHRHFDLVLYGPEARAEIFLKNDAGYVLRPVSFRWHSRKWFINERGDLTWRRRKFLRNQEPPKLEGNEITWKMIIEDELQFDVWFVFKENSFMATYAAELAPIEHERGDGATISFYIPPMAVERKDIYYSHDFPQGLPLDTLREAAASNRTLFNLSTKEADRYAASWALYGYQRGKNDIPHNFLCRRLPNGILSAVVRGYSFGPRILTVAPKQNDILLNGASHRADIELWEGFSFHLTRPADQTRHRLTKTKAFELTIE